MPIQARALAGAWEEADRWDLDQIHKVPFRLQGSSLRPVVVAVLDTGADTSLAELQGKLYPLLDVVGRDTYKTGDSTIDFTGRDGNGHGTHVTGIVLRSAAGFDVRVLPVKVIPHTGVGDDLLLSTGIERALAWRDPADSSRRVRVMNLSVSSPRVSERLRSAIKKAVAAGVLVVGASGNGGGGIEFPASMPEVLSVGATTYRDKIADYSGHGPSLDMAAPGGDEDEPVISAWPSYLTFTDYTSSVEKAHTTAGLVGTSMAAPHVTGAAAVLWARYPDLAAGQIRSGLLSLADDLGAPGPDPYFGFGRLNFQHALMGDRHDAY